MDNIYEMMNTSCKELRKLKDAEKWHIAKEVACYYQSKGFPYIKLDDKEIHSIVSRMWSYDVDTMELGNKKLRQIMLGLDLADSCHPQMWEKRTNSHSPIEIFWSVELFTKAIYRWMHNSNSKLQPSNIRKSILAFSDNKVSNFKPIIAKYIYEKYCPPNGAVLDPCSGYSGRLLGALCSSKVRVYIGIDTDVRQLLGGANLGDAVLPNLPLRVDKDVHLLHAPFEGLSWKPEIDLVFTSLPNFDGKQPVDVEYQVNIQYPTYDEWKDGFLLTLVSNSYCALKNGGYFAVSMTGYPLVDDVLSYANNLFGKTPETKISSHSRSMVEIIYIWRKS